MPVVELRSPRLNPDAPWVGVDNHAMGQIVADHLMQRGFRHFGVYELGTESYFEERRSNFVDTVTAAGYRCSTYQPAGPPEEPLARERHQEALSRWVRSLPKPVGIMACTDQLGFFLLEACARAGIVVPEEVAVVGVENEESLCTMAVPMLSSVQFDAERIGYEAAAVLARLMRGEAPPAGPQLIEPLGGRRPGLERVRELLVETNLKPVFYSWARPRVGQTRKPPVFEVQYAGGGKSWCHAIPW
jgi:LacI family transcriptional regulator